MLLYSVLGAVQGMAYTYLSSVLTTIERQFGIKSQEAAWIFSGNEVSQIAFIFVLPFLTRLQKRIMWTSVALIVSAVSKATISIQYLHIIYTISTISTQYLGGHLPVCDALPGAGQGSVRGRLGDTVRDGP